MTNSLQTSRFDGSEDRVFTTQIGVGQVIKGSSEEMQPRDALSVKKLMVVMLGWDEAIPTMSFGEKIILTIDRQVNNNSRQILSLTPLQ